MATGTINSSANQSQTVQLASNCYIQKQGKLRILHCNGVPITNGTLSVSTPSDSIPSFPIVTSCYCINSSSQRSNGFVQVNSTDNKILSRDGYNVEYTGTMFCNISWFVD